MSSGRLIGFILHLISVKQKSIFFLDILLLLELSMISIALVFHILIPYVN